jgi:hypothetical protein
MTVVMAGKSAFNPLVSKAPARQSETSAASTRLAIEAERINQNVALSAFHPLEASKPRVPPTSVVFTIHDHDGRHSARPARSR